MTNYGAFAANSDKRRVKETTDLAAVVMAHDVVEPDGNGRLIGLRPLHIDTRPSFAVWTYEGTQWAGCWACGWRGDLFDFLMTLYSCSFPDAVTLAVALRDGGTLPDVSDVGERGGGPPKDFDPLFQRAYRERNLNVIGQLLNDRGIDVPAVWIADEFDVVTLDDSVLIPHRGGQDHRDRGHHETHSAGMGEAVPIRLSADRVIRCAPSVSPGGG